MIFTTLLVSTYLYSPVTTETKLLEGSISLRWNGLGTQAVVTPCGDPGSRILVSPPMDQETRAVLDYGQCISRIPNGSWHDTHATAGLPTATFPAHWMCPHTKSGING